MNRHMSVETLGLILDELAGTGRTDYVEETVARAGSLRQLPAWRISGNWLPRFLMTKSDPVALAPRARSAALIATTLLVVAALVAAAVGRMQHLPAPFGPAGNGRIAFAFRGEIYVADSPNSAPRLLVGGPDSDNLPLFSPQGTRLAFLRTPTAVPGDADFQLMLADADGSNIRPMSGHITGLNGIAWLPDGSGVLFGQSVASASRLVLYLASGEQPVVLDLGVPAESPAWRPPDGRQFAFLGLVHGQWTLHVANRQGEAVRDLGLPGSLPAWSPDGTKLAFTQDARTHVAEVDAGGALRSERPLAFEAGNDAEIGAVWSPDGRRLAFIRGRAGKSVLAVANADGTGYQEVGVESSADQSRSTVWLWSPDGKSILQTFDEGITWLLDPDGGTPQQVPFGITSFSNWQRVAP